MHFILNNYRHKIYTVFCTDAYAIEFINKWTILQEGIGNT